MRKRFMLVIAVFVALSLGAAACGDDSGDGGSSSSSSACPKSAEKGDASGKKVGLMFDITGRGDQSFNDSAACGLDRAVKDFKLNPKEYPPTGDSDRADRLKLASTTDGRELVVAVGFLWATPITEASKAYPNVKYTIVDSVVAAPNVLSVTFKEEEGSYLVGVAAALKTKSGKIGFIGGVEQDLIKKFEAGFVAGAKATKSNVDITVKYITPDGDFTGFNAPDKGQEIARGMYDAGVDIIYAAAGSSGTGMFKAAKEYTDKVGASKKVWGIGVDSDQYNTVGADLQKYVLTSMLKRVDTAVYEAINGFTEGTFAGGTTEVLDLKAAGVDYATTGGFVDDIKSKIDAAKKDIIDGKITVPSKPTK
ncbi:MAG TPA: BMP family ABC transporter substrate-binding protein [Acidimicrobiales bacterium]|nr:BMP family ABC transporter substrate-binding protein [Acidimicrobiales bacterium]